MMLVVPTDPGTVELNFMWLPTWLGLSAQLKTEIEAEINTILVGQEMTDEVLQRAHDAVITVITSRHPQFEGLRDYLDAIKFVRPAQS